MSLIECPECGSAISDAAHHCRSCDYAPTFGDLFKEEPRERWSIGPLGVLMLIAGAFWVGTVWATARGANAQAAGAPAETEAPAAGGPAIKTPALSSPASQEPEPQRPEDDPDSDYRVR